ncbi:hypothetical protein [Mucilaginibacter flavidus]|uniref:hypothetical protein n=1 Tax=Mucilaginibacter flavidus TaxID=2949309 RepID=UPI002092344A|nr:hypothetical protein [Mucilaginibacter flavidus]MCO5948377.1 hypothetical protein [Mucilaginibacter flavidus]
MKNVHYYFVALALIVAGTFSCSKSKDSNKKPAYTCTTCKATPDAVAANDASNKGIYKGIIIGSSGTIKFDLANSGTTLTATLAIDGVTATLTASVTTQNGDTYVSAFTGTWSGQPVSITFSVGAGGQNPTVTAFNIPGHASATFTLAKETSNALIECFEGTYSTTKPETGTFNLLLSRSLKLFGGASRKTGSSESNSFHGSINANSELVDADGGKVLAKLTGDVLAATFVDGNGSTVTVTGKRTF